jgi:hypothetical protein
LLRTSLSGAADFGTLPDVAPGISFALAMHPAFLRFELFGTYWGAESTQVVGRAIGGNFTLVTGGGRVCADFEVGLLEGGACGIAELDSLAATGSGATSNRSQTADWVALGPGASALLRLMRPLALRWTLDAVFPLRRAEFDATSGGQILTVHQPSLLSIRSAIGLEVAFF